MKRSEINEIMRDTIEFLDENKFSLPRFAFWSLDEWKKKGIEVKEIIQNQLGWDITDFGSNQFNKIGLMLFTIRNGNFNDENSPALVTRLARNSDSLDCEWEIPSGNYESISFYITMTDKKGNTAYYTKDGVTSNEEEAIAKAISVRNKNYISPDSEGDSTPNVDSGPSLDKIILILAGTVIIFIAVSKIFGRSKTTDDNSEFNTEDEG